MFPHTVTVYNKYRDGQRDGQAECWQRTVLRGVLWDAVKGAVVRKTGVTSADSLRLIIPMSAEAFGSVYKPPREWEGLTDKYGFWTLQSGDLVVLGALDFDILTTSAELKVFDNVLTITSVDTKAFGGGMDFWEVSAR